MTADELVEKVARALASTDGTNGEYWDHWIPDAIAAIRVVHEAIQEATPAMHTAANLRPLNSEGFYKEWNHWRAMLAASPLAQAAELGDAQ